jgi:hypothetical protein
MRNLVISPSLRKNSLAIDGCSDLDALAAAVRAGLAAIACAEASKLHIALDIGDDLAKAKVLAGHGNWLTWLESTGLSARTAEVYIKLAAHRERIANSQHAANLTIRGALRLIGAAHACRKPQPRSQLKSAAWKNASRAERAKFVNDIPLVEWLEVIPASWRNEIEDRIDGLRAVQAKPVPAIVHH